MSDTPFRGFARLWGAADEPVDPEQGVGMRSLVSAESAAESASLVERYSAFCRGMQVSPHPAVLVFMRLHLAELRPEPYTRDARGQEVVFSDADMFSFCDFVLRGRQPSPIFEHWRSIDASRCNIGVVGVQMLMRVLQQPGCQVHTVDLGNQNIGPRGAHEVVETLRVNRHISHLRLNGSFIHDAGGRSFARLLADPDEPGAQQLGELDLSVNMLSFDVCKELQLVAPSELKLVLSGNRVLDEVLNASSHAIGVVLVIIGAVFLGLELAHHSDHGIGPDGMPLQNHVYVASNVIYLISLFCLYLFSTLYHALFALGDRVVGLFQIFDHSAIYLLIAGTYSPFLTILFPDRPVFSVYLLSFLWLCGIGGIILNLCYSGPYKVAMQVTSYVAMGWAALLCAGDVYERLLPQPSALWLLVGGGVSYTVGVIWFVKDSRSCGMPDHTIWHLFVLGGSIAHYYCVLLYVVPFPYGDTAPWMKDVRGPIGIG